MQKSSVRKAENENVRTPREIETHRKPLNIVPTGTSSQIEPGQIASPRRKKSTGRIGMGLMLVRLIMVVEENGKDYMSGIERIKEIMAIAMIGTVRITMRERREKPYRRGTYEYIIRIRTAVLGMSRRIKANEGGYAERIMVYLAIERQSRSMYIRAGRKRKEEKSAEAARKYYVRGAIGSGIILVGRSNMYIGTGMTNIEDIGATVMGRERQTKVSINALHVVAGGVRIGIRLVMIGRMFKIAAVPFHM